MNPWAEAMLAENADMVEALGPISAADVDGSYLSWLRLFHFRYKTPGMKQAMVMATNAVLTNRPLPVSEERTLDESIIIKRDH